MERDESKRILIADADGAARQALRDTLVRLGHAVAGEASEGVESLKLARRLRPEVVILAAPLPGLDGAAVAEAITRAEIAPVLLILEPAVSAADETTRDPLVGSLRKPFQEADLRAAIDAALAQYHRAASLRTEVRAMRGDPPLRDLVRHAKSILMRQHGISEAEAFARIQQGSLQSGRTLRQVAADLVQPAAPRRQRRVTRP